MDLVIGDFGAQCVWSKPVTMGKAVIYLKIMGVDGVYVTSWWMAHSSKSVVYALTKWSCNTITK